MRDALALAVQGAEALYDMPLIWNIARQQEGFVLVIDWEKRAINIEALSVWERS